MQDHVNLICEDDTLYLRGKLDFAAVMPLWVKSQAYFNAKKSLSIDFAQINYVNSAALSLMLEWVLLARQKSISLQFKNIPEQLRSIAAAAGVSTLF